MWFYPHYKDIDGKIIYKISRKQGGIFCKFIDNNYKPYSVGAITLIKK